MHRKMSPPTSDAVIILDDELYFPQHEEVPGNGNFTQITRRLPRSELNTNKNKFCSKCHDLARNQRTGPLLYLCKANRFVN